MEGRTAAFFCYGDGGGDELDESGRPKILEHKNYFNPELEPFKNMRDAYAPLVWQCRYGGVEVPDNLWQYQQFGDGKKYSDNQSENMIQNNQLLSEFDSWVTEFKNFVELKGKVPPGKYRAFGYEAPIHKFADIKLKWRALRMSAGHALANSSPKIQNDLGLNKDATFHPKDSTSD